MQVKAEDTFEIEIKLEGTFSKGHPGTGPSYASGGDPPEPDRIEDPAITDLGVPVLHRVYKEGVLLSQAWLFCSLMEGVDPNSPDIKQLFENILAHRQEEILEALFAETED